MLNLKLRKTESVSTLNQVNTAKNKYSSLTYILAQSCHLHFILLVSFLRCPVRFLF